MDERRLEFLLELSRVGSMRSVAERLGTTTSTVSQQLAALGKEAGVPLLEPVGRNVRLTPAGRRLAEHAATILGDLEAARRDLDPGGPAAGTVHVGGFATAISKVLLPLALRLRRTDPDVRVVIQEHETAEALQLLAADELDLAITYDYNLAPVSVDPTLDVRELWSTTWGLAVRTPEARGVRGDAAKVFAAFRGHDWIGNSRNRADEYVVRVLASIAGFEPHLTHQADSLDVVEELILNGLGVGLLPADRSPRRGLTVLPLARPELRLRAYANVRRGRSAWPALRIVLEQLAAARLTTLEQGSG